MSDIDVERANVLAARYADALERLENATNHAAVANARAALLDVKVQARGCLVVLLSLPLESPRMVAAAEAGVLDLLISLRDLDLGNLIINLPNTETFEQRGIHT